MKRPDRRLAPRIHPFVTRCMASAGDRRLPGYVTELSARGARIVTPDQPPSVGTSITLELAFRRPERQMRITGSIKWVRARPNEKDFVFGLAFLELTRENQELLAQVIADFADRAARIGMGSSTAREGS